MIEKFDSVLFDFDGTLAHLTIDFNKMRKLVLNELSALLGAEAPVLKRHELPVMELIHAACTGQEQVLADKISKRCEDAISAYEIEVAAHSSLFPQVEDLLKKLKHAGVAVGIVTRNCLGAVETVFPNHSDLCGVLVCRGDVPPAQLKPHPGQIWAALKALHKSPDKSLMVGDHPMDIQSGKAAGCFTAGVLSGNGTLESLQAAKPDWISDNVASLFRSFTF